MGNDFQRAHYEEVQYGPVTLDGFLMEDDTFRLSMRSAARALTCNDSLIRREVSRLCRAEEPSAANGSEPKIGQIAAIAPQQHQLVVPVSYTNKASRGGTANTISLATFQQLLMAAAASDNIKRETRMEAIKLLGIGASVSIERVFEEAFGIEDRTPTGNRLLQQWLRHFPHDHQKLFGGEFYRQFRRVTGCSFNSPYSAVRFAEVIYHRLPQEIYDAMKEANSERDARGRRVHTYSQYMKPDALQFVQQLVHGATIMMAATPSRQEDPKAYRKLLAGLDLTYPRHRKSGRKPNPEKLVGDQV